jgi:hypothetical protein
MQHGRITGPNHAILADPRSIVLQGRTDVDLFIVTLHRLHTVLAAEVADPRDVLSGAIERFGALTAGLPLSEGERDQPATIAGVRNALEHGQNLAIRGDAAMTRDRKGGGGDASVSVRGRALRPSARLRLSRCRLSRPGPASRSRAGPAHHRSRQPRVRTSRRQ